MAALVSSSAGSTGLHAATQNVLTASDTFVYKQGAGQRLILRNASGLAVTLNLLGNLAVPAQVPGVGPVAVAAGFSTGSLPNSAPNIFEVALDTIYQYLTGTVTITGGIGCSAYLYDPTI